MTMTFEDAQTILAEFLNSPSRGEGCFTIDQLLGAMTAILSSPEYISDVDLGFMALSDEAMGTDVLFSDGPIRSAWVKCLNEIDESLALERFSLSARYNIKEMGREPTGAFSQWCDGYLRGYFLCEDVWVDAYDFLNVEGISDVEDDHMATLSLLAAFTDWNTALNENEDPQRLQDNLPLLFDGVNEAIGNIHGLGMLLRENSLRAEDENQALVHESERIGRNDPCPCGSGKKYKKCCLN